MHPKEINLSEAVIKTITAYRKERTAVLDTGEVGASSIQYCLRRQYYQLINTGPEIEIDDAEKYKLYQGDISEKEMAELMLLNAPYFVAPYDPYLVPVTNPITGMRYNPDRILYKDNGLNSDNRTEAICPIEFKHLDTYGFMKIAINGVKEANYTYYVQSMIYAYVHGFDGTKFFATAKSPAAVKTDIERKLKTLTKKPGVQSVKQKEQLMLLNGWSYEEWIPVDMEIIEEVIRRKNTVLFSVGAKSVPNREYEPGKDWNCDYCPFIEDCVAHGE